VIDGNGVLVTYGGRGQEIYRTTIKGGIGVQTIRTSINSHESEFERKHRLAEGGDNIAEFNLGLMYENGHGIPLDFSGEPSLRKMTWLSIRTLHLKEAEKWYVKSAKKGNSDAMFNLGAMYHNGNPPKDNPYIAYAWFSSAKENGHEEAERSLDVLTAKMTKAQLEKANSLLTEIYNNIKTNSKN
jgi:TPR repeat protein